jgi:hypothetical protein
MSLLLVCSCQAPSGGGAAGTGRQAEVVMDGRRSDPAWSQARTYRVTDHGTNLTLQVVELPGVVLFGIDVPEEMPVVARETLHGGRLQKEDQVRIELAGAHHWSVVGTALGTLGLAVDGKDTATPIWNQTVQSAAHLAAGGWRLEMAVRLDQLAGPGAALACRVIRERRQRGNEPTCTVTFPELRLLAAPGTTAVRSVPLQLFAPRRRLPVTAVSSLPVDEGAWAKIPALPLHPERGGPIVAAEFQETFVRAAVATNTISFRIECRESWPESIEQTADVWRGDSVELSLGADRLPYPALIISPSGRVDTCDIKVGRNAKPKPGARPAGMSVTPFRPERGGWGVVVNLPLQSLLASVGGERCFLPPQYPWRVQVVRNRPAREALGQPVQTSLFAVTHSDNTHCPARFGDLQFRPSATFAAEAAATRASGLPPPVLDAGARVAARPSEMLRRALDARTRVCQARCDEAFDRIGDRAGWEAFAAEERSRLMRCLFPADHGAPPARGAAVADVVFEEAGEGFTCTGVLFETFRGLRAPGVLYRSASSKPGARLPALIVIPSHHSSIDSYQVQVLGVNFARNGGISLAVTSIGAGERNVVPETEHQLHQRHHFGVLLQLAGEEISGWTAFEVSRAVDYLLSRPDVDPSRIALVGAVAGGGDLACAAAAFDPRISIAIPFNFSGTGLPGPYYDFVRAIPGAQEAGLSPFVMNALIAPRRQVQSHEFGWSTDEQANFDRLQKVYAWLGAPGNLSRQAGWEHGDVLHFGQYHRLQMYGIFMNWLDMRGMNVADRMEHDGVIEAGKLACLDSSRAGALLQGTAFRTPLDVARQTVAARLAAARAKNGTDVAAVRNAFAGVLGRADPADPERVTAAVTWTNAVTWESYPVKGLWYTLSAESPAATNGDVGGCAVWLFTPKTASPAGGYPLVLGFCRQGKARFLAERGEDVKLLLASGIRVALADLADCGETDCGSSRSPRDVIGELTSHALLLGDSLPAIWVRQARTVLRQLVRHESVDPSRIGLWGEGFSAPNGKNQDAFLLEEVQSFPATPAPKELVEPMGEMTCLLAALLEQGKPGAVGGGPLGVKAVLLRGGLSSYQSAFASPYYYFPQDSYLPRMVTAGDVPDLVAALQNARVAVLAEDMRDARNRTLDGPFLRAEWGSAMPATYAASPGSQATQAFIRRLTE